MTCSPSDSASDVASDSDEDSDSDAASASDRGSDSDSATSNGRSEDTEDTGRMPTPTHPFVLALMAISMSSELSYKVGL